MAERKDNWKYRRRFMVATVGFCMGVVSYVLAERQDTEAAQNAVNMAFFIIGSTVSSYVFGAVWDDKRTYRESENDPAGRSE